DHPDAATLEPRVSRGIEGRRFRDLEPAVAEEDRRCVAGFLEILGAHDEERHARSVFARGEEPIACELRGIDRYPERVPDARLSGLDRRLDDLGRASEGFERVIKEVMVGLAAQVGNRAEGRYLGWGSGLAVFVASLHRVPDVFQVDEREPVT